MHLKGNYERLSEKENTELNKIALSLCVQISSIAVSALFNNIKKKHVVSERNYVNRKKEKSINLRQNYIPRSDQKFCNLKEKYKEESSGFILLSVQNGHHDYLYKVPSFLTVSQNVFLYSSSGIFFTILDTAPANHFPFPSSIKLRLM